MLCYVDTPYPMKTYIFQNNWKIKTAYCVLNVNAAEVMELGSPSPLMISCHSFLLITSTRPPLATTRLYSSYRSSTCLAMMGRRLMGVPRFCMKENRSSRNSLRFGLSSISYNCNKKGYYQIFFLIYANSLV